MSPTTTFLVAILGSALVATAILGHPMPQTNDGTIGIMGSSPPAPNGTISVMVPGQGVSVMAPPSRGLITVLEPIVKETIAFLRPPQTGIPEIPVGSILKFPQFQFGRHRPTGTMSGPPQGGAQGDIAVMSGPPHTGAQDDTAVISGPTAQGDTSVILGPPQTGTQGDTSVILGPPQTGTQDDTAVISGSAQTGMEDGTAPGSIDLTVRSDTPALNINTTRRILPISLTCTEQGCADGSECDPTTRQCRSVAIEI